MRRRLNFKNADEDGLGKEARVEEGDIKRRRRSGRCRVGTEGKGIHGECDMRNI